MRRLTVTAALAAILAAAGTASAATAAAGHRTQPPRSAVQSRVGFEQFRATLLQAGSPDRLLRLAHRTKTARIAPAAPVSTLGARPTPFATRPSQLVPDDPDWNGEWGLQQIGAPLAWALVPAGRPAVIAVIDSGVDPTQPDLQGALVPGADFADSTGSTADQFGHGTMVAGVIAARGNNGEGVAGACWSCLVMPVKVLDASGMGSAQSVAEGIRFAVDNGANVINMSFVLSAPDQGVADAIAYAEQKGVVVVAAAGNSGSSDPTYPASYPGVVSVAATDDSDQLYPWSTYGPWVNLAAPGCTVSTAMGGGFDQFCGTSAAAPLVAGLAGLAFEAGAQSAAQVVATLESTASPFGGAVGGGRVDAAGLVQHLAPEPDLTFLH